MAKIAVATLLAVLAVSVSAQDTVVDSTKTTDQVYGHLDGMALYYDVEIPAEPNGLGVVLVVSGGFVSGPDNLNISRPFWEVLLGEGYTLFEIYHPAMPRYRIPDAYDALRQGVDHIQANAERFGVDAERLGILGISSGGHLALLLALSVEPGQRSLTDFKAVLALMPLVDIRDVSPEEQLFGARLLDFDPARIPEVSPVDYVSADDPPVLLIHGTEDRAVDYEQHSLRMHNLLEAAGVENSLLTFDAGHEIFPEPMLGETHEAMLDWLAQHL